MLCVRKAHTKTQAPKKHAREVNLLHPSVYFMVVLSLFGYWFGPLPALKFPTAIGAAMLLLKFAAIIPAFHKPRGTKYMASVLILMGSQSDWPVMQNAATMLNDLGVSWEARVVSAHRTPDLLPTTMKEAEQNDVQVVIAGAGGAAHLPGMLAAFTHLPVLGVPVPSKQLKGLDSLLSIVQMPKGVAVGTMAIGEAGAANAGLLAAQIVGTTNPDVQHNVQEFRANQRETVIANSTLELDL